MAALELFKRFQDEGLNLISECVEQQWIENDFCEFKQAESGSGPMTKKDRQSLGKGLSAFANAEGGLLIWGVRAGRESQEEIDAAKEKKPIKQLRRFLADLSTHAPLLASPPVGSVLHHPIHSAEDEGFIVTFIPQTEGLPVMSIAPEQHRHYIRAGGSSIMMTTPMLADRFQRRPQAKLEFFWRFSDSNWQGNKFIQRITVGIRNSGRGIARFPAMKIRCGKRLSVDTHGLDGNTKHALAKTPVESMSGAEEYDSYFTGGSDVVIYPGTEFGVTKLATSMLREQVLSDLCIPYSLFCDGFELVGNTVITSAELMRQRGR